MLIIRTTNNTEMSGQVSPLPVLQNTYRHRNEAFLIPPPMGAAISTERILLSSLPNRPNGLMIDLSNFVKVLENYSCHMATFETAKACQVLDEWWRVVSTTIVSPTNHCSPDHTTTSSHGDNTVGIQNKYWERLIITPFLLFAAAEELVMDYGYLVTRADRQPEEDSPIACISGLFLRIQMDLLKLKESVSLLCSYHTNDDTLSTPTNDNNSPEADHTENNTSEPLTMAHWGILIASIGGLLEVIRVRCKLIELQCLLFLQRSSNTPTFHNNNATTPPQPPPLPATTEMDPVAVAVVQLSQALATAIDRIRGECGDESLALPIDPLVTAMKLELVLWQCIFETCAELERCSFAGTLLKLRKWQVLIGKVDGRSCGQTHWVVQAHRHILSLLPLYFDRIYTFASPLYGFDTTNLWSTVENKKKIPVWNEVVCQFLRQQEKAGTTAAVCLALETSSDARPDRGYQIGGGQQNSNKVDRTADGSCWHAMYIRSTIRLAQSAFFEPSPHASGPLSSQASLLVSWRGSHLSLASASNSPALPASRKKIPRKKAHPNQSPSFLNRKISSARIDTCPILEYALDSDNATTTWPHSIWERLSVFLCNEKLRDTAAGTPGSNGSFLLPTVRIYHVHEESDEPDLESKLEIATAKSSLFGFRWGDDPDKKQALHNTSSGKLPTKIYVTRISDGLRFLVIVKGSRSDSDGNNQGTDGKVREFLDNLAIDLAPRAIFHSSFILKQQMENKINRLPTPLYLPNVDLSLEREGNDQLLDYLDHVKAAFGLQSVIPSSRGESYRSRSQSIGRYPTSPRRPSREHHIKMDASAVALFLGPELSRYI